MLTHQPLQHYNAHRAGLAGYLFPCASVVLQQRVRRLALSVMVAYARLPLELWDDRRLGRMRHQRVANLGPITKKG